MCLEIVSFHEIFFVSSDVKRTLVKVPLQIRGMSYH